MFDIGWQELFILAILAIIVIGPKDLPRAIKTITHWIRKVRTMARDLQDGLDDVVREAELEDIKSEANKIMDGERIDPTGSLMDELAMGEIEKEWGDTVDNLKIATDPNITDSTQALSSDLTDADDYLVSERQPKLQKSAEVDIDSKNVGHTKG
ncbi:MAG: twin-arginine translocase subunit TatB [Rhodospirillaceae bacterium TMED8]|nr:twin-arginine translocase subunit TatB [Magnetovibrio sp.]OUT51911.1 MAG: twin-arginine translocase subunit TatB [Rhodospirillaceae bacterium TMED8]|tara:strand:+ start:244 stop:705 length:462 start_codon:yes stop_codon:yes gene_type:complete